MKMLPPERLADNATVRAMRPHADALHQLHRDFTYNTAAPFTNHPEVPYPEGFFETYAKLTTYIGHTALAESGKLLEARGLKPFETVKLVGESLFERLATVRLHHLDERFTHIPSALQAQMPIHQWPSMWARRLGAVGHYTRPSDQPTLTDGNHATIAFDKHFRDVLFEQFPDLSPAVATEGQAQSVLEPVILRATSQILDAEIAAFDASADDARAQLHLPPRQAAV